jgi:hypothetical protein
MQDLNELSLLLITLALLDNYFHILVILQVDILHSNANCLNRQRGRFSFQKIESEKKCQYRSNHKDWKPVFSPFAKARKRVETLFAQLCDQFMIIRNYAKQTEGLFTRITGKISALTILQSLVSLKII